jgi:alpha-1,3-rhamnosyl/mannosyltransferase
MRVCVDCSPLLINCAGVKSYLYYFARNLQLYAGENEFEAFPFLGSFGGLDLLDSSQGLQHEESMIGRHWTTARLLFINMANKGRHSALNWFTPGADIFHATNHVRNPPTNKKLTTTLHDLTCWTVPDCHPPSHIEMEQSFVQRVVLKADSLIAISEATRNDLIRIFDFPPEKVEVIYPGISDAFFDVRREQVDKVREKYGLSGQYLIHVGTIEPRKNTEVLLDAYGQLSPSLREEFPLVFVGSVGWAPESTVGRVTSPPAHVRYLGYVPEDDLPGLTAGAAACVYPSLYEGFGLPVSQAMAVGVPVLTSNVSSLPEVAGGSAVLIDPHSTEEIRAGIERLLLSPSLRDQLAAAGPEQARRFTWERSAKETWKYFERVCGNS